MKTFEERYTAWIDGKLSGSELAAFEKLLDEHPESEAEKEAALKLSGLLRSHGHAPPLKNSDFFNHQLLTRIASDEAEASRPAAARPSISRWRFQPFPWVAACCLLLAFVLYREAPRPGPDLAPFVNSPVTPPEKPYTAEIVSAESTDPDISVTPIHSDEDKVTVLWVDGMNYLPASYHVE